MKQEPTKVQVLDALQTHKTVQKAVKAYTNAASAKEVRHSVNHNAKQVDEMTDLEKEAYADGRRTPSRFLYLRNIFNKGE